MSNDRRTALGRRALAAWGPTKQRRACAGECSELAAELIRDSLGRHDEPALAEEVVGALQTIASVVLTIDPEIYAAAELAQAAKLEAKLEAAEAAISEPIEPKPDEGARVVATAPLMARLLWENLSISQQAAMRAAVTDRRDKRKLKWDTRADTTQALRHAKCIERNTPYLTPVGLAVRAAGGLGR